MPAAKNTSSMIPRLVKLRRWRGTPNKKMPANKAPVLAISQPAPRPGRVDGEVSAPEILCDAVVFTVSVDVPEAFAMEFALNAQVGGGVPPPVTAHVSATAPLKPPVEATVIVDVEDAPAAIVAGASAGAEIVKPGDETVRLTV